MKVKSAFFCMTLAAISIACESGPTVRTNQDPTVNLKNYKTFGFMSPLGTDKSGYGSLVSTQLKQSSRREMEKLGYVYQEQNPELLLNFNGKLADKMRVDSYPVSGGYYGYRAGYYGAWPAYTTSVDQYKEGTLNIDLVDVKKKELVWEGVAVDRITEKDQQNVGAALDSAVVAVFAKFPGAPPPAK